MKFFVLLIIVFSYWVGAEEDSSARTPLQVAEAQEPEVWKDHRTFVPEKFDYYYELGAMWEERNMYWMGAGFGRHFGKCFLSGSETCQQYWDLFGGVGGRDGLTSLLFLTGPRWQFVNFPKHYSPSVRLFAGVMNIRDDLRDKEVFTYGGSYGFTMSVHERIDLRLEGRIGHADEIWYQSVVGVHVKMDHWVDYFGSQIKKIGIEAFKTTGGVLKKTGNVIGEAFSRGKNKSQPSEEQPQKSE